MMLWKHTDFEDFAMPRSLKFWLVLVAVGGLLVWGGWRLLAADDPRSLQPPTATAQVGTIEDLVSALGSLQPLNYVDVGTQVSGQLKEILVELGDNVRQGQLLARIDPSLYQARVGADEAQLLALGAQVSERRAQLALAEQQLVRQRELLAARATSRDAYDSAAANVKIVAAQLEALKAQIQQVEANLEGNIANLSYTSVYAPMAGTVVSITARQGQTLVASQQAPVILQIADLDTMTVRTQVSEADITRLRVGMPAYFTTLGNPDRRRTGTLRQILPTPELVNNVVLYDALFDVANPERDLLPKMTAQVFFVIASAEKAVLVPAAALRRGSGPDGARNRNLVMVAGPNGIEERTVEVGVVTRAQAEIVSGLAAGERVVLPLAGAPQPGPQPRQRMPRI